jgi:hypothetical protein
VKKELQQKVEEILVTWRRELRKREYRRIMAGA